MIAQRLLAALAAASLAGVAHAGGSCTEAVSSALEREVAVLRQVVEEAKGGLPEVQQQVTQATTLLDRAATALEAGSCYLALERLNAARQTLEPAALVAKRVKTVAELTREVAGSTKAALEKELDAQRAKLDRAPSPDLPAAVRAMRAEAAVQAPVLAATMPMWYGIDDFMGTLYYGGSGIALGRAAAFMDGLAFDKPGKAPTIAPLERALADYERALIAAYRPPQEKERHVEFISASAALKTAQELQAAGRPEGTLYVYLRARRIGARLTLPALDASTAESVRAGIERWRPRLAGPTDHSIAALFLEQAEAQLALAATSPDALRVAAGLVDDVLPEYSRLASAGGDPAAASVASSAAPSPAASKAAASSPAVTVTLVRWPYT